MYESDADDFALKELYEASENLACYDSEKPYIDA